MLGTADEAPSRVGARAALVALGFEPCVALGFCIDEGDDSMGERFAPNIILPRLENSSCSKRSSDRRLSLGISVVRGMKAFSSCRNEEEMEPRDASDAEGLV
jgi:hypothetical protein